MGSTAARGKVYLVGGGPGDPGLLTLRGAECLAEADLVLYDGLVNPLLLQFTSGVTERTARIRRDSARGAIVPQAVINQRLIDEAQAGRVVVRLKGGDPCIFGRGNEEARALEAAGIPYEIVPGITSATAAGEYAGFSFTDRAVSSAVALVTGHEDPTRATSRLDYRALAAFPGTLVFYMGLSRLPDICGQLIAHGLPSATPAAVVCRASLAGQQVVTGTVGSLPGRAAAAALRPPSLIIVGDCVRNRESRSWYERLPLFGLSVAVTRAASQYHETARQVIRLGGEPLALPLLSVGPVDADQQREVDSVLARLTDFGWLLFTSRNAVTEFFRQLWESGQDARALGGARIGVVGAATAAAVERVGLRAELVPDEANAAALAAALRDQVRGCEVLWLRGTRAKDVLPRRLREDNVRLTELIVYSNDQSPELPDAARRRLQEGTLDWVAAASPAACRRLAAIYAELGLTDTAAQPRLAVISAETAQHAQAAGLTVSAVAARSDWPATLQAIADTRG